MAYTLLKFVPNRSQFQETVSIVLRKALVISLASCVVWGSALATDLDPLFDVWGTEQQCSRQLLTPKGTKHAAPFDIRAGWLGHGAVWCRLSWGTAVTGEDGLFAIAHAICGEDAVRGYDIKFRLQSDQLTLVWNLWLRNGPLMRCEG